MANQPIRPGRLSAHVSATGSSLWAAYNRSLVAPDPGKQDLTAANSYLWDLNFADRGCGILLQMVLMLPQGPAVCAYGAST